MKALLLIGGEGTRLRPLTCSVPKALAPVLGKPLLERIILWLKKYNVKEINLAVCYKPDKLKRFFSRGEKLGVKINYIREGKPLGTGGAIKNSESYIKETAVMFNGDVICDIDLGKVIAFHKKKKAIFTDVLVPVDDPSSFGLVRTEKDGKILEFLEKPSKKQIKGKSYINAGIYVVEPEVFKFIPKGVNCSLEKETFPLLLRKKQPFYAYKADNAYWIDVGTNERYRKVQQDMLNGRIKSEIPGKQIKKGVWINSGTKFYSEKSLKPPLFAGSNCRIAKDAVIYNSSIGNNVTIGEKSIIENSIIWDNTKIGKNAKLSGCTLGYSCLIDDYTTIGERVFLGEGSKIPVYSKL